MMQQMIERGLTDEQRTMRETIRHFVDREVTPFIRKNWQLERPGGGAIGPKGPS